METSYDIANSSPSHGRHRLAFGGLFLFTLLLYARPNEAFPNVFGDFPLTRIVAIATLAAYVFSKLARREKLTIWPIEFKMLLVIAFLGFAFIPVASSPQDSAD